MQVPLLDLRSQYQSLRTEIIEAVVGVCDTQQFILGPAVRQLETTIAAYTGCAQGVGVSSGTDALLLALMALDIGPGDAVLTTSFTFFATAGAIARTGALPVFLDIDPETFNLSPAALREFLEQSCERRGGRLQMVDSGLQIRALLPVHLYGQLADMAALMRIARDFGLAVIEDAAQSLGATDAEGKPACSFGEVGCLSFFPTKNLGAFGDAGMCVSNDAGLARKMSVLRVHGAEPKYHHSRIGGNFRLDELQAAVLNVKASRLDEWARARERNARFYDEAFAAANLGGAVTTPFAQPGARHVYNQYVIRAAGREALRNHLASKGVGTEIYYPIPLHLQECFAHLGYARGSLPESERAAAEVLALPIYPELESSQLQYVVDCIADFYRSTAARMH